MRYDIDLDSLDLTGKIKCGVCARETIYVYGTTGKSSQHCGNCGELVLVDYDRMESYPVGARTFTK